MLPWPESLEQILQFMERGGIVLWGIFGVSLVLWSLMYVSDFAAVGQDPPGFDDTRDTRTGSMEVVPGLTLPTLEPCRTRRLGP